MAFCPVYCLNEPVNYRIKPLYSLWLFIYKGNLLWLNVLVLTIRRLN